MRTIVYVDGYNLFYSLLTKSPYKWLDLSRLFTGLVRPIAPSSDIGLIKYFTAPILGSMASDPRAEQRQAHYHRALKAAGGIEIIRGFHIQAITTGVLVDGIPGMTPGQRCRVGVWGAVERKAGFRNCLAETVRGAVQAGEYASSSEIVREALRD